MNYENEIRAILSELTPAAGMADAISSETNLQYIGIDSIIFVRAIIEIENFFGIEFPDDKLTISESGTLKKLCKTVNSIINQKNKREVHHHV
jgi:acyl carrier protein